MSFTFHEPERVHDKISGFTLRLCAAFPQRRVRGRSFCMLKEAFMKMWLSLCTVCCLLLFAVGSMADTVTYTATPSLNIPDDGPRVSATIDVPVEGEITGIEVYIDISHAYSSDLIGYIQSPAGTELRLFWIGEGGESNTNPVGWYPEDFTPKDDLAGFNSESTLGTWTIKFQDMSFDYGGTLNEWRLRVTYDPIVEVDGKSLSGLKGAYQ
jgi:subtilisin-like proprotein convertase family protein